MKAISGKVGNLALEFERAPCGSTGTVRVRVSSENKHAGEYEEIRWARDADGIWIETPRGVRGYDITVEVTEDGARTHKLVDRMGSGIWQGLRLARAGEEAAAGAGGGKKKAARVRAQMPGKIVRVLVKAGQEVEKDQPLLVMEAMKMENEIRSAHVGKIAKIAVAEGQAVETGAELVTYE